MPATLASAGAEERIRSPISGWRRTKRHSSSLERAGLAQDRIGDRELAYLVQLGGEREVVQLRFREAHAHADRAHELGERR